MRPLLSLCVFWLLPLALMLEDNSQLSCVPRRSVPYTSDNALLFREEGVFNYSSMLLREDLGLLVLGSREAVFALDLRNISSKFASVEWKVSQQQVDDCKHKGKDAETECKNYIRILHTMKDGRMYVCGTNAFDPECKYMSYADGKLTFKGTAEDGKGKCPFDPFQRYASIMVDDSLYSATSMNFLGSEPVLMRNSVASLRTEFKSSWLNEPIFVSMAHMPESEQSNEGNDDKVYLFFSETAVECDCHNKLVVSRVARVCKGDQGGERTLQRKWTSFLKTRMDCPVLFSKLPYLIQDSYRWCDLKQSWKDCIFYAIFTPQTDTSDMSAVCAYRVSDISKVFSDGKYKTPVPVETSFVKWVMYSGDVPVPRPGACINNEARKVGITRTLDLPDRTLQFIKDKPLMDQAIQPIGGRPLLMCRGATFTRIIVTQVQDADGETHHVMFIGTEDGTVLKAVNYDGEMFIIEEVHVFQSPEPIKNLKFSSVTGQIYAGSDLGAAQMPLATCGRSMTCLDCVLARDPYCGWDTVDGECVSLSYSQRQLIQSVKRGNASLCPAVEPIKPVIRSIWPGGNLKLSCPSPSNLAKMSWEQDKRAVTPSSRLQLQRDGLLILNASVNEAGLYRCLIVERSKANEYTTVGAEYQVHIDPPGSGKGADILNPQAQTDGPSVAGLQAGVAILLVFLLALLAWNFYKGHLPCTCVKKNEEQSQQTHDREAQSAKVYQDAQRSVTAENKALVSESQHSSNNNHSGAGPLTDSQDSDGQCVNLPSMQYIDDESEF
ncbi:semaphorin-4E [Xenentodon cancila]